MTPEQQREQFLKRLLPALAVLILYFAIISNFVTGKTKKAEEDLKVMQAKGIDAGALPSWEQELDRLSAEQAKLQQELTKAQEDLANSSGFLAKTANSNDALDKLAEIFAKHHLQVLEEKHNDGVDSSTLPKAFNDAEQRLKELTLTTPTTAQPAAAAPATPSTAGSKVNLRTINYTGSYLDNYRALTELAAGNIKLLPVSLTMHAATESSDSSHPPQLQWQLTLWL